MNELLEKEEKVPVTVLTGYLGSGKTTLLNRILSENHGKRIAVIENEFGEVGVDNELVIGADEEIFEMNNGCICCTVRGDLIRILNNLMQRKDKFDYILIETTGMADPAPVAQTFFVDDEMKEKMNIDSITTMVDAKHVWQHIDTSDECKQQIAFADVIIINKIDLVSDEELKQLERKMRSINALAKIYKAKDAAVEIEKILNVKAFDLHAKVEINPEFLKEEVPFEYAGIYYLQPGVHELVLEEGPDLAMDFTIGFLSSLDEPALEKLKKQNILSFSADPQIRKNGEGFEPSAHLQQLVLTEASNSFPITIPAKGHYMVFSQHHANEFNMKLKKGGKEIEPFKEIEFEHSHEHDAEVSSVGIDIAGELDERRFQKWISYVLQTMGTDIFRSKGILNFKNYNRRIVFQGVHMLFDAKPDREWRADEARKNQIVFIGRNLDRDMLVEGFNSCLYR
ncbi:MAG: CobW family GTP-binding protein [Flammeovirgaceae bacterium]